MFLEALLDTGPLQPFPEPLEPKWLQRRPDFEGNNISLNMTVVCLLCVDVMIAYDRFVSGVCNAFDI